eukprot:594152-Amphidinium_carterae.1
MKKRASRFQKSSKDIAWFAVVPPTVAFLLWLVSRSMSSCAAVSALCCKGFTASMLKHGIALARGR